MRRGLVGRIVFRSKTAALDLEYEGVNDALLCDDDVRKGLSVALELHEPELEIHDTMFQLDESHGPSLANLSDDACSSTSTRIRTRGNAVPGSSLLPRPVLSGVAVG